MTDDEKSKPEEQPKKPTLKRSSFNKGGSSRHSSDLDFAEPKKKIKKGNGVSTKGKMSVEKKAVDSVRIADAHWFGPYHVFIFFV